jgi:hypothetical protein
VILSLTGVFGGTIDLDLRGQFGEQVELQCFQFITPPIEFRLMRNDTPLHEWQRANTEMYDLQHPSSVADWARDGHSFVNDVHHRDDAVTCGVLSKDLKMETRGLALTFILMVWLRESTIREQHANLVAL